MSVKILLVEDDDALSELFTYYLEEKAFNVVTCADGEEVMDIIEATEPDLVLLDWMLPNVSGLELCRQIRLYKKTKQLPVILLTAKSEQEDKIRALDAGADDYITKPPAPKEMIARIRAVLRRTNAQQNNGDSLIFGDIRLDRRTHRVFCQNKTVHLGPTEFKLLECLMERPGRVLSREQLLDMVWKYDTDVELRTVDVHIGRLRKSLRVHDNRTHDPIRTVRATGYALDETYCHNQEIL